MVILGDIRLPSGRGLYSTSPATVDTVSMWGKNVIPRPELKAVVLDIGMVIGNFYFRGAGQRICAREGWQGESEIKRVEDCLTDPRSFAARDGFMAFYQDMERYFYFQKRY
ncbi:MAG: hypothetical protein AABZ57_02880 [Candidatus Margulisiibacteriota bacterium]